mgnify:CR=1 FL=1
MNIDKKISYISIFSLLFLLSLALFIPIDYIKYVISIILIISSVLIFFLIKKRNVKSVYSNQILLIMVVMGISYLIIYYLSGLKFGFYQAENVFSLLTLIKYILPISAVIISFELIRNIFIAQENKLLTVLSFVCALLVDFLLDFNGISTFNGFMDIVGLTLMPSIMFNLLYHYLSKNYGWMPSTIFRLIITIYIYIIPFLPSTPDSLMALAKLLIPLFILGFIRLLYEKKRKYAKEVKSTKSGNIIFAATICLMISLVMLISNQFRFGMVVIATDSMNDEIKSGDIVVFEKFTNDDIISIGQIIVFKKEDTLIIHRVVDIKHIDGVMQYYTKGDANEKNDDGFITKNDIVGYVNFKIPYLGYPSLWIRELFKY